MMMPFVENGHISKEVLIGVIPEFPVTSESAPPGRATDIFRLDALVVIIWESTIGEAITVGLEIKDEVGDLLYDTKIPYEVGKTDLFFLAVPPKLLPCALCVIADLPTGVRSKVGLVNLDCGDVILLPERTVLSDDVRLRCAIGAYRQALRGQDASALVSSPPETEDLQYVQFDRHMTNTEYLQMVLDEFAKGYDYTRFRQDVKRDHERYHASLRYQVK